MGIHIFELAKKNNKSFTPNKIHDYDIKNSLWFQIFQNK